MQVKFWGVRGSIPTPQAENGLFGGETACVELFYQGERLILDAGSGVRRLGYELQQSKAPLHVLLSHFHWDHIQGMPFFAPLYGANHIHFYSCDSAESLHTNLSAQMAKPFFPLDLDAARSTRDYVRLERHQPFEIGPFRIIPFPLHHPQGSTAFRVEAGGHAVVYATDHELGQAESDAILLRYAQGADVLIADAQYTPEEAPSRIGFGHSTWLGAAELAAKAGVGHLLLFHHDPTRSDSALEGIVALARRVFPRTDAARERTTISLGAAAEEQTPVTGAKETASDVELERRRTALGVKEHTIRVLLVDDQRIIGETIRRMLAGHVPVMEYRFCHDAANAQSAANEFQPTLILQDLVMPDVDGLDTVKAFRANPATEHVPIIVLSSKEDPATKAASFAAGANDYVVKLPDKVELLARIRYHSDAYVHRLQRMEAYEMLLAQQKELETLLQQVYDEKLKSELLLLNILPEAVAYELKESGNVRAMAFGMAGVLFADFSNFTALTFAMTAEEVVSELNECFTAFDKITMEHGVEKLKTIGDGYLCVAGIPEQKGDSLIKLAETALEIRNYIRDRKQQKLDSGHEAWDVRVGLHCGPLVAGVVGVRKFAYDVWGDTVNTASRMESSGVPGRVNISRAYFDRLPSTAICEPRGHIEVKGKGAMEMFFLDSL